MSTKKKIIISIIASVGLTTICFITNLLCANLLHTLPLGISIPGGDCIEYIGFGVDFLKIYAFSPEGGVSYLIEFNLLSFLTSLVLFFVIAFVILLFVGKKKTKK